MNRPIIFRAFAYRNYRLFWSGQVVSLIGSWMQRVALGWLVYRLTQSPFMLGVVEFAGQMPAFIFAPFAGFYLDYWNRRNVLIFTQFFMLLQALFLAALVLSDRINIIHVVILNVFFGLINAFDMPARQAFLKDIIERREDLGNAIALNSSMFNAARMVGPSIAGFIIAWLGEGICFLINAITFTAVLLAIKAMRLIPRETPLSDRKILKGMREGFGYAFHSTPIRITLLLLMVVSLLGLPYVVLLPALAKDVFQGDATTLGWLTAAAGVGALYGAYYLASRKSVLGLEKVMLFSLATIAIAFLMIALIHLFWLALVFIVFLGFGFMTIFAIGNTILQTIVADHMRGRVLSFYAMTFLGMAPIGSLIAGTLAKHLGVPITLLISGALLLLIAMVYYTFLAKLRQSLRMYFSSQTVGTSSPTEIVSSR
ncbi:MFS transporter [candidate division KSB1 bacterium]|nr:MFS transporter [candidate division KSB1 bacterium]